jgi:L-alanine-DL-glutamate epimerase-like enolase superfamily enzyme
MLISKVEAFLLSYPFPQPLKLPYHHGERTIVKRDAMLIRVESDSGLVGYAPAPGDPSIKAPIDEVVGPFLTGRTLADPDALRIQFLHGSGASGRFTNIYSTVELALYDLLGHALGVPLSELVGGRVRDRIVLYGSGGMYMPPEGYAAEAAAVEAMGFRAYKMRPGIGPEGDIEAVRQMRRSVGPGMELMVDAHTWWRMGDHSYSSETVDRVAAALQEFDITWLEEPLPPSDHAAYQRLNAAGHVSLASGEHEPSEGGFLDLIHGGGVEYVQMDVICQGGIPAFRRIMPEIAKRDLRFAFHSWGTSLEVVLAAHLGICWPDHVAEWLEYPCYSTPSFRGMYDFPLAAEILTEPLIIENGELVVPNKPGLGVTVDLSVIEKYPWIPGPWSFFTLESPPGTWAVTGDHAQQWSDPK